MYYLNLVYLMEEIINKLSLPLLTKKISSEIHILPLVQQANPNHNFHEKVK